MKKLAPITLLIFLIFFSCGKEKEKNEHKHVLKHESVSKITDFYNFKHFIDTDYAFDVKITNVRIVEHKDIFEVEKEKYGKPEKINGISVFIEFEMKNPYSRFMRIPFPTYYELGSEEFKGDYISKKNTELNVDNRTVIKNTKSGYYLGEHNSSGIMMVDFKPNEKKSYVVEFPQPFPSTINKITFIGFRKHLPKKEVDKYDFNKEEDYESFLADQPTEYGFVIDLKSKKIIDLISFGL